MTASMASLWTAARRDLAMFFTYIDGAEVVLRGDANTALGRQKNVTCTNRSIPQLIRWMEFLLKSRTYSIYQDEVV